MSGESASAKPPLDSLGHDILVDNVFPYLDEGDIIALSRTSKALHNLTTDPAVWHDLYFRTFGLQPNPFTVSKWPEIYRWRSKAGLFTWGARGLGRLGFSINEVGADYTVRRQEFGVCRPKRVAQLDSTVVSDVAAGGYSFTVLTAKGQLYGVGELTQNPYPPPHNATSTELTLTREDGTPVVVTGLPLGITPRLFLPHTRINPARPRIVRNLDPPPPLPGARPEPTSTQDPAPATSTGADSIHPQVTSNIASAPVSSETTAGSREGTTVPGTGEPAAETSTFQLPPNASQPVPGVIAVPFTRRQRTHPVPTSNHTPEPAPGVISEPVTRTAVPSETVPPEQPVPGVISVPITRTTVHPQPTTTVDNTANQTSQASESADYPARLPREKLKSLSVPRPDRKFVSVSSGRTHIIALDDHEDIWIWDKFFLYPGALLTFSFNQGRLHKVNKIRKIAAGWGFNALLVENVGVVWFEANANYQDVQSKLTDPARKAAHHQVEFAVVPFTNNPPDSPNAVVDIMSGSDFLIYLTSSGELFRVDASNGQAIISEPAVKLKSFHKALNEISPNQNGQFVKLSGSYEHFAAFTDTGNVLIGTKAGTVSLDQHTPTILPELQNSGCISVAFGDHHALALLQGGRILSWGVESRFCGAFGLGNSDEVVQKHGARNISAGLELKSPTEITIEGHALAIAAAGWQSCAIITTEDIDED